jgi:hypothetical protein
LQAASQAERDARDRHAAAVEKREACEQQLGELQDKAARDAEVARIDTMLVEAEAAAGELERALRRFMNATMPLGIAGENAGRAAQDFGERLLTLALDATTSGREYAREIADGRRPMPVPAAEAA